MSKQKTAWHFVRADRKLGYGDGRTVAPGCNYYDNNRSNGKLCRPGLLHWSYNIMDALKYAPGPILCEVLPGGKIFVGDNKSGSTAREVLRMADITNILREAACQFAELALSKIKTPDPRSLAAIQAKRDWMAGRIGDRELVAARAAADAAARATGGSAARAAAWVAAGASAMASGRFAACAAAWTAVRVAAGATSAAAAMDEQEQILLRLIETANWEYPK